MSTTYVKNLHEGDRDPKGYSSWKDFWEAKTGSKFGSCSRVGCVRKAEAGAHVIKTREADKRWYIVPLCAACNNPSNADEFRVVTNDLVLENQ